MLSCLIYTKKPLELFVNVTSLIVNDFAMNASAEKVFFKGLLEDLKSLQMKSLQMIDLCGTKLTVKIYGVEICFCTRERFQIAFIANKIGFVVLYVLCHTRSMGSLEMLERTMH